MAEIKQFSEPDGEHLLRLFNSPSCKPGSVGLSLSSGGYKAAADHIGYSLCDSAMGSCIDPGISPPRATPPATLPL